MVTSHRFTTVYGVVHDALLGVAKVNGLATADMRLLLALAEHGGRIEGTSHELAGTFGSNGTSVRRSSVALSSAGLIENESVRGLGMRLMLTDPGRELATAMLGEIRTWLREAAERNGDAAS